LAADVAILSECDGGSSEFEGERLVTGFGSKACGGGLGVERSPGDSTRRSRLKIECLRDCGSGASSAVGGSGDVRVFVDGGKFVGAMVVLEEVSSGFAIRKPPND
jgi:hypothetical protein